MSVHSLSRKGWIVIPAELRKKYQLQPGSELHIVDYGGVLAIVPALEDPIDEAAGLIKSKKKLTEKLIKEHRNER